jgi:signal transduction histidine kinase
MRRAMLVVVGCIGAASVTALVVGAARADSRRLYESMWMTMADIAVGLAFLTASIGARAAAPVERLLMAGVGATWLLASSSFELQSLHQGLLVLALVAHPSGRPRGPIDWLLAGAGIAVLFGPGSAVGVALIFAAVAATSFLRRRREPGRWYRASAGAAVSLVVFADVGAGIFDPRDETRLYELVLILVAFGFVVVSRRLATLRAQFAEQLIGQGLPSGLDGLGSLIGESLGDSALQVYRWNIGRGAYVNPYGATLLEEAPGRAVLYVDDGGEHVAAVQHRAGLMDDPAIARAVGAAVRLTADNVRLREELDGQLIDLEAARTRLLAAADLQRSAIAARLREEVVVPLRRAAATLDERHAPGNGDQRVDVSDAAVVAAREISEACDSVLALVGGVPPVDLGDGRLPDALESLARSCPVPVTVTATPGVAGDASLETTLFYVCSEALTNVTKHAAARHVDIDIEGTSDVITVSIRDDGCGGADPAGSGILGLSDRVAARGGRLRVDSPAGAGTCLVATLPRQPIF